MCVQHWSRFDLNSGLLCLLAAGPIGHGPCIRTAGDQHSARDEKRDSSFWERFGLIFAGKPKDRRELKANGLEEMVDYPQRVVVVVDALDEAEVEASSFLREVLRGTRQHVNDRNLPGTNGTADTLSNTPDQATGRRRLAKGNRLAEPRKKTGSGMEEHPTGQDGANLPDSQGSCHIVDDQVKERSEKLSEVPEAFAAEQQVGDRSVHRPKQQATQKTPADDLATRSFVDTASQPQVASLLQPGTTVLPVQLPSVDMESQRFEGVTESPEQRPLSADKDCTVSEDRQEDNTDMAFLTTDSVIEHERREAISREEMLSMANAYIESVGNESGLSALSEPSMDAITPGSQGDHPSKVASPRKGQRSNHQNSPTTYADTSGPTIKPTTASPVHLKESTSKPRSEDCQLCSHATFWASFVNLKDPTVKPCDQSVTDDSPPKVVVGDSGNEKKRCQQRHPDKSSTPECQGGTTCCHIGSRKHRCQLARGSQSTTGEFHKCPQRCFRELEFSKNGSESSELNLTCTAHCRRQVACSVDVKGSEHAQKERCSLLNQTACDAQHTCKGQLSTSVLPVCYQKCGENCKPQPGPQACNTTRVQSHVHLCSQICSTWKHNCKVDHECEAHLSRFKSPTHTQRLVSSCSASKQKAGSGAISENDHPCVDDSGLVDQLFNEKPDVRSPSDEAERDHDLLQLLSKLTGCSTVRVRLGGPPGAGKSTLANALLGKPSRSHFCCKDVADGGVSQRTTGIQVSSIVDESAQDEQPTTLPVPLKLAQLGLSAENQEEVRRFITIHPDKVVIVCDSLDEVSVDELKGSLMWRLLQGKRVAIPLGLRFVLTTQLCSEASDIMQSSSYRGMEVVGFSQKTVDVFVRKFLGEGTGRMLLSLLDKEPLIASIMQLPLFCLLVCDLFQEEQKLPTTKTEIYSKLMVACVRRSVETHDLKVRCQDGTDAPQHYQEPSTQRENACTGTRLYTCCQRNQSKKLKHYSRPHQCQRKHSKTCSGSRDLKQAHSSGQKGHTCSADAHSSERKASLSEQTSPLTQKACNGQLSSPIRTGDCDRKCSQQVLSIAQLCCDGADVDVHACSKKYSPSKEDIQAQPDRTGPTRVNHDCWTSTEKHTCDGNCSCCNSSPYTASWISPPITTSNCSESCSRCDEEHDTGCTHSGEQLCLEEKRNPHSSSDIDGDKPTCSDHCSHCSRNKIEAESETKGAEECRLPSSSVHTPGETSQLNPKQDKPELRIEMAALRKLVGLYRHDGVDALLLAKGVVDFGPEVSTSSSSFLPFPKSKLRSTFSKPTLAGCDRRAQHYPSTRRPSENVDDDHKKSQTLFLEDDLSGEQPASATLRRASRKIHGEIGEKFHLKVPLRKNEMFDEILVHVCVLSWKELVKTTSQRLLLSYDQDQKRAGHLSMKIFQDQSTLARFCDVLREDEEDPDQVLERAKAGAGKTTCFRHKSPFSWASGDFLPDQVLVILDGVDEGDADDRKNSLHLHEDGLYFIDSTRELNSTKMETIHEDSAREGDADEKQNSRPPHIIFIDNTRKQNSHRNLEHLSQLLRREKHQRNRLPTNPARKSQRSDGVPLRWMVFQQGLRSCERRIGSCSEQQSNHHSHHNHYGNGFTPQEERPSSNQAVDQNIVDRREARHFHRVTECSDDQCTANCPGCNTENCQETKISSTRRARSFVSKEMQAIMIQPPDRHIDCIERAVDEQSDSHPPQRTMTVPADRQPPGNGRDRASWKRCRQQLEVVRRRKKELWHLLEVFTGSHSDTIRESKSVS